MRGILLSLQLGGGRGLAVFDVFGLLFFHGVLKRGEADGTGDDADGERSTVRDDEDEEVLEDVRDGSEHLGVLCELIEGLIIGQEMYAVAKRVSPG